MKRVLSGWTGIILLAAVLLAAASLQAARPQQVPAAAPPPPSAPAASSHRATLNRYCVTCHNARLKTGDLILENLDPEDPSAHPDVWEKVVRKLRTRAMPPAGAPRPDAAMYDEFADHLETILDRTAATQPNPGRTAVHRLNRSEYANAVRDLLAIDVDAQPSLPNDDSGEGFDNIAEVLSVSPTLLERYLGAARKITRQAVGETKPETLVQTYRISDFLGQDEQMSEELPFGSRAGTSIRHYFTADGEYNIKIFLRRSLGGDTRDYLKGLLESHQLDLRLDGARVKLFQIGGGRVGRSSSGTNFGDAAQEDYEHSADSGLELRIPVKAGTRLIQVTFLRQTVVPEGLYVGATTVLDEREERGRYYVEGEPTIDSVTVRGPYNAKGPGDTPSRRRIFICRPNSAGSEEPCATKIVSTLARRAYRRPLLDADIQPLLGLYRGARKTGGFEDGIRVALQGILISPAFLFRVETDPVGAAPGAAHRVSDLELASRLSFFLWSSLPDDELLDLAAQGKLEDKAVLERQVRRMLADARSDALVSNFAGQWLLLRNIETMSPDPEEFPEFDENLRAALRKETELFFGSMLREDRGMVELLTADHTFLNERLARHYGIPDVYGSQFRRVALSDDNRRGLLGHGSLLATTSYATRTSVVLRGKWILSNILGTPPPPPPPNVPDLKDRDESGKILSVRQQMEKHRANAVCAGCHSRMDPLGFALENFDALGKWRTTEGPNRTLIDPSGVLPDGTKLAGAADLRRVLAGRVDQFVTTLTEKLLIYALGREISHDDAPVVRKILRDTAPNHRWSSVILGIVNSTPFQMRRARQS